MQWVRTKSKKILKEIIEALKKTSNTFLMNINIYGWDVEFGPAHN